MAGFFGNLHRANGNFMQSAPAGALKKRLLSSDPRYKINNELIENCDARLADSTFPFATDFFE